MNKKIKLKVNTGALVRSMKDAFTSEDAVITELAQNARRAKATSVTIRAGNFRKGERDVDTYTQKYLFDLEFYDNGNGVMDMQKMVSVAESGWDKDTIEEDNPFGMGFLIAIYQSQHITVTSKGRTFSTSQQDILDLKPIDVKLSSDTSPGTTIVMRDVCMGAGSFDVLKATVSGLLKGFPIDVAMVNLDTDESHFIARPFSEESLQDLQQYTFPEGTVYVSLCNGKFEDSLECTYNNVPLFFQGLEVRSYPSSGRDFFQTEVFHANKKLGRVRLPDRSDFVNATDVSNRFTQIMHEVELRFVLEHKDDTAFLLQNFDMVAMVDKRTNNSAKLLQLYNDIPTVPTKVSTECFSSRHCLLYDNSLDAYSFFYDIMSPVTVSQDVIGCTERQSNYIVLTCDPVGVSNYFSADSSRAGEVQALMFLLEHVVKNYVIVAQGELHEDHWLTKNSITWDDALDALSVDVVNPREHYFPKAHPLSFGYAVFCDSFNISAKLNGVEYTTNVTDDYCVAPPTIGKAYFDVLLPVNCTSTFSVSETEIFMDYDTESFDDSAEQTLSDAFSEWLALEKNYDNPAKIIKNSLSTNALKTFNGRNFRVDITNEELLVYEVPNSKDDL